MDTNAQSWLQTRPTLAAWLEDYEAISQEYVAALEAYGIDFAPYNDDYSARQTVKERLRHKGARFRNGDASISVGPLSSACAACATDAGSKTFYYALACNRSCYFCFNRNQVNYEAEKLLNPQWPLELARFLDGPVTPTHVALTGGEPLLYPDEAVAFFAQVQKKSPAIHSRLYTDGDFLDEALAARLAAAGLQEIRFSIKPDDPGAFEEALRRLAVAKAFIPSVMVEMPVVPEMKEAMKALLRSMDELGVFGINLLEFGYPLGDWEPFAQRGYQIANPPFAIPYDYSYAGGLPVAGSELVCLELLEFALDESLQLGVHYCSLENKNRMQIYQQDTVAILDESLWHFDDQDFFWKTAKLFDGDGQRVRLCLEAAGATVKEDPEDGFVQFHPRFISVLADKAVVPVVSVNVMETTDGELTLRELGLYPQWPSLVETT